MSWWEALMWSYELALPFWLALVSATAAMLFFRRKRPMRFAGALLLTTASLFLLLFWVSRFGWGWTSLAEQDIVLMRMAVGAGVGFNAALFAWILSGRLRWVIALALIALNAPIFIADPSEHSGLEIIASTIVLLAGLALWYRGASKAPAGHLPQANL